MQEPDGLPCDAARDCKPASRLCLQVPAVSEGRYDRSEIEPLRQEVRQEACPQPRPAVARSRSRLPAMDNLRSAREAPSMAACSIAPADRRSASRSALLPTGSQTATSPVTSSAMAAPAWSTSVSTHCRKDGHGHRWRAPWSARPAARAPPTSFRTGMTCRIERCRLREDGGAREVPTLPIDPPNDTLERLIVPAFGTGQ